GARYLTFSRSWTRMSLWLRTPTGRPASSITGAALNPFDVNRVIASWTVTTSRIDTGSGVMRSAAVVALRVNLVTAVIRMAGMGAILGYRIHRTVGTG